MKLSVTLKRLGWYSPEGHPAMVFRLDAITFVNAFEMTDNMSRGPTPAILVHADGLTYTLAFHPDSNNAESDRDAEVEAIMAAIGARGTVKA